MKDFLSVSSCSTQELLELLDLSDKLKKFYKKGNMWLPSIVQARINGSRSRAVIPRSFMNMRTEGPATSSSGSPTVSPIIVAL